MKDNITINLNFDTVICPLCYTKFNKSLAKTPLSYMKACPHCSVWIDDGYFTRDAQKKLAKHLEKNQGRKQMNEKPNCIVISHEDNSVSFVPKDCVLYITEWFDENKTDLTEMMNCRVVLKNNQGIVIGKYNRELFSPIDFFAHPDYANQKA